VIIGKKFYCCVVFLVLTVILYTSTDSTAKAAELERKTQKGRLGFYVGGSFSTDPTFYRYWYKNIHFLEGVDYQLGAYYEFPVKGKLSLAAEVNLQNFYSKYETKGGYHKSFRKYGTENENDLITNLTVNVVYYPAPGTGKLDYLTAGAGIGVGETSMELFKKIHFHFQIGMGRKFRLTRKSKLNIQLRVSFKLQDKPARGSYMYYPGLIAGLEF